VALLTDRPVFIAVSAGGRFSGERTRQPDFLTPYLKAVFGIIGLHDLTFFTVEGTGYGPDGVTQARIKADQALEEYFRCFAHRDLNGNAAGSPLVGTNDRFSGSDNLGLPNCGDLEIADARPSGNRL
jgi:hypothetical protein